MQQAKVQHHRGCFSEDLRITDEKETCQVDECKVVLKQSRPLVLEQS
jgi:hypothetical protein